MTFLVFGKTGQVARELAQFDGVHCVGRAEADLRDPDQCVALIKQTDAKAVINAAAYTAVDRAEAEPQLAHQINATTPGAMAQAAAERGLPFVQISTDYVFDGSGDQPWSTQGPANPLGVYGQSKWNGEELIRRAQGVHAILRTSWVFSAHGSNFVKTMLALSDTRPALSIVADQVGGPTPAADIAQACVTIANALCQDPKYTDTYHFSGAPAVSWADFARAIFAASGKDVTVTDIPSSGYPTPAARPPNSRLDCTTTTQTFGLPQPDWHAGLMQVLDDLNRKALS
ncbi:dTDP-4-dehydrorhamnose reductase [Cochlodiniinecator piscidefendens]|uniref:dTDP-4-dehydrorhamnose reductase n=1 Tax=Cochlodiniinecator piscidefendens TaxID=2715756 RepID=UPI00140BF956|nr:dTDP-4-dehydrorhamnose reductase [Cochlodiniinecator piscidefendens]